MHFSLQQIHLTNFRGVNGTLRLDFSDLKPGLYFVRGRNEVEPKLGSNGASKSSLFIDSIYWALTNKISRSNRPGSDVENWASGNKTTSVAVNFLIDDEFYCIERTRKPNSLKCNGKVAEQREIDDILPLTDSALRRSILINPFEDMFLSLRPEDKSRMFSEALDLDVWLKASDNAGQEITSCEKEFVKVESSLSGIKGSLSEARDLFETSEQAEANFQKEQEELLLAKRQTFAGALERAKEAESKLDIARLALSALSAAENGKYQANNLRGLIRQRHQALIEATSLTNNVSGEIRRLKIELEKYSDIRSKICPECGQSVSDKHILEKRRNLTGQLDRATDRFVNSELSEKGAQQAYNSLCTELEGLEKSLVDYDKVQYEVGLCAEVSLNEANNAHRLKEEITELKNKKNPFTEQCSTLEVRITNLLDQRDNLKEKLEDLNRKLEIYKFWQRGFKEIRLEQLDTTLIELEMSANKHAESLGLEDWEIEFQTERETKKGSISHGFSIFLYPPGQKDPVSFESYSGGETQRLQLASTFGLAEVLLARSGIETDFEVLDEPTSRLSPEGIDDLLECLSIRSQELGRRIFVIDQHTLDRGNFDGVITVIRSNKGVYLEDDGLFTKVEKRERVRL